VTTLKTTLKKWTRDAERIALLGVGSELRGDDIAGLLAAKHFGMSSKKHKGRVTSKVFIGDTAPENLTGEIKRFKPTHLIIVDSADMGKKPGTVRAIDPNKAGGLSFCTHKLPVKILTDYIAESTGCQIMIIGIQPKRIEFCGVPSKEIQKSAKTIADTIAQSIPKRS